MNILEKAKLFIWPKEENFEIVINDSWKDILTYFILGVLLFTFLTNALPPILERIYNPGAGNDASYDLSSIIVLVVIFIPIFLVSFFVNCILVYATAKVLGGQGSFKDMIAVWAYASTPAYILGCIPFLLMYILLMTDTYYIIGWTIPFAVIYVLILPLRNYRIGVMRIFKLSLGKAVAAVLIPLVPEILAFLFLIIDGTKPARLC